MHLTIVYITGRLEPHFEWFADSLHRETGGDYTDVSVVVVDYWAENNGGLDEGPDPNERRRYFTSRAHCPILHVPPKPTVWQGRHRLTRQNYFAAANARNTGAAYAADGYLAYADDLAVLVPGWLAEVRRSVANGYVALGAYRKIAGVRVESGVLIAPSDPFDVSDPRGVDSRWPNGSSSGPVDASGAWMYGCSVAMPVEALLRANGWDERADARGLGSEDYLTGMLIERQGYLFKYCRSMLTVEEDHATATPFVREIATAEGRPDASHVILGMVRDTSANVAPNYFPEGGLREVRRRVLLGEAFPTAQIPEHCWYTGTPLREL